MVKSVLHLAAALAVAGMAQVASASLLISEDFATYAPGDLVGQNGWAQTGASSSAPLQVSGGRVVIPGIPVGTSADNQDAHKDLASSLVTVPNTVFFAGLITVNSAAPSTVGAPPYVLAVSTSLNGGGFANWRLTFRSFGSGYQLGARVTGQGGSPYAFGTTELAFGQEYLIVAQFNATSSPADSVSVFINPTTLDLSGDTPDLTASIGTGTPPTGFGSVIISQFATTAAGQPDWSIGALALGTTATATIAAIPEPGALAPLALAGLMLTRRRR